MERLPDSASNEEQVRRYFETRARQLGHEGFTWDQQLSPVGDLGFVATFQKNNVLYQLPYLRGGERDEASMAQLLACVSAPLVNVNDYDEALFFEQAGCEYVEAGALLTSVEYRLVEAFYGDQKTRRSGAFLMNHIDEGLTVLRLIGASEQASRAFCLHPLLQNDEDLAEHYSRVAEALSAQADGAYVLGLAMEYRSVANDYLSHSALRMTGIRLSPLKDVNDMLIADKVQNRKDYERFHEGAHPNSKRLTEYFKQWVSALGVTDSYAELRSALPDF